MTTMSTVECGEWLLSSLATADSALAEWLDRLAEFDDGRGWAADGQLSCVDWLTWRGRLARSTAYERLQVAHQLRRRPILRDAFRAGRVSYSVARVMARMIDPDPEVDEAVVAAAEVGTVRDVERLVGAYMRHADQHRRPDHAAARRGVRVRPNYDGTATIELTLEDLEVADFMATIDAFVALSQAEDESARADGDEMAADSAEAVDESARADGEEPRPWQQKRADAVMDMARTAVKHAGDSPAGGDERFVVHVLAHEDGMTLLDGTPLDPDAAARLACDSSATRLLLGPDWEPLAMGRRTRSWTTAQRRAVIVRDGGRCRFPGCQSRRYLDLHHHRSWARGGPTNVSNGYLACSGHHALVHAGWTVTGDANKELTFHRPDGTILGATRPRLGRL